MGYARPGTDPVASAVEARSLSRRITRDVLNLNIRYTFGWLISVAVHQTPFSSFYRNYNAWVFCLALEVTGLSYFQKSRLSLLNIVLDDKLQLETSAR